MMWTNWKTTTAGIVALCGGLAAFFTDLGPMIASMMFDLNKLVADVGLIGAGFVGIFGKDFNVTGGTRRQ